MIQNAVMHTVKKSSAQLGREGNSDLHTPSPTFGSMSPKQRQLLHLVPLLPLQMNVPLTGRDVAHLSSQRFVAQRFAAQRFAAQKVDDQCPTKAILPGLNSWPWGPTLDPPNALYAKLMPENLMRQNHNSLEEDRKIENCRTLAQEFGRLYEQARALSVNFDELQRKMPVASDSTSEGSVDLNFSCSRSEDMEVFSL